MLITGINDAFSILSHHLYELYICSIFGGFGIYSTWVLAERVHKSDYYATRVTSQFSSGIWSTECSTRLAEIFAYQSFFWNWLKPYIAEWEITFDRMNPIYIASMNKEVSCWVDSWKVKHSQMSPLSDFQVGHYIEEDLLATLKCWDEEIWKGFF